MNSNQRNTPLPPYNYKPREDEPYMNPIMLAYFGQKLLIWKKGLLQDSQDIKNFIAENTERKPDFVDEGLIEETREIKYILSQQNLVFMKDIDNAIERINNGSYGYCEKTGEEIGVKRLDAWPIATFRIKEKT